MPRMWRRNHKCTAWKDGFIIKRTANERTPGAHETACKKSQPEHLPPEGQASRCVPVKQMWSYLPLLSCLPTQLTWCVGMGRRWKNKGWSYPAHRRCITYGWISEFSFLPETFHIHNWTKSCLETQVTRGLIITEEWVASSGYPLKFYSEGEYLFLLSQI